MGGVRKVGSGGFQETDLCNALSTTFNKTLATLSQLTSSGGFAFQLHKFYSIYFEIILIMLFKVALFREERIG